ncbi:complex I intermediate-associated protein 30-domain-containing protein [Geopyxis carbonaria]|nr:complex I intermediate-associated protein 30-domain-containing protein [Geopyxis carbonaria]
MKTSILRSIPTGFVKRNLEQMSIAANRVLSVGGLNSPVSDLELISFRDSSTTQGLKVFTDQGIGGFSQAQMDSVHLPPSTLDSDAPAQYARFHGTISIELPTNQPNVERSGFAAWRTQDPQWTLLGRAVFNCEAHAFLALRIKSDGSKYYVNLQSDSMVTSDLFQHRLFTKKPGQWETVYLPFTDFVKMHMGGVMKRQERIPQNNLTTVGLGLIDRIPGPFELCIEAIWATNTRPLGDDDFV